MTIYYFLIIYFVLINLAAILVTMLDKYYAIAKKYRISENSLLSLALLGGSLSEYLVMKVIRHKTKKKKFMIGLPLISVSHGIVLAAGIVLFWQIL